MLVLLLALFSMLATVLAGGCCLFYYSGRSCARQFYEDGKCWCVTRGGGCIYRTPNAFSFGIYGLMDACARLGCRHMVKRMAAQNREEA